MKAPEANVPQVEAPPYNKEEPTGLPLLHTWRSVYLFVFGCFVLSVLLLLVLTVMYS